MTKKEKKDREAEVEEKLNKALEQDRGSLIKVGDLLVSSSELNLRQCSNEVRRLLKDKTVSGYLKGEYSQKRMIGID